MLLIGVDTGVHTGIAVWDSGRKCLLNVSTTNVIRAMFVVLDYRSRYNGDITLRIEDARQRKWFGRAGREQLQGAGSIKRDCQIWETFCEELGIDAQFIAPKNNITKLTAEQFNTITGWQGRTTEHSRDAAMLVFGR